MSGLDLSSLAAQLAGSDERFKLIAQLLEAKQQANGRDHEDDDEEERQRRRDAQALRFLRRINTELARAAGACVCWGKRPGCGVCHGAGRAGFRAPDEQLFLHYFGPLLSELGLMRDEDTSQAHEG